MEERQKDRKSQRTRASGVCEHKTKKNTKQRQEGVELDADMENDSWEYDQDRLCETL